MRNLTINRKKSFVGCAEKMKIYIEDPSSNDLVINNVSCRKLGTLKNNEEKTFVIEDSQAKVFVIADKLSKGYCNEFYQLPEGQEDVYLTGKNKFNLATGNAFRFDNNNNAEVLRNHKNASRKGILVIIIAAIAGGIIGFLSNWDFSSSSNGAPKKFSDNGMSITLTNGFKNVQFEGLTNCYDSADVAVLALKEEFTLMEGFEDYTLEEYGELVLINNGLDVSSLNNVDGLLEFEYEYTNPETNENYIYCSFIYKSDDAFWLVQFATLTENIDTYSTSIVEWAKSVSFE